MYDIDLCESEEDNKRKDKENLNAKAKNKKENKNKANDNKNDKEKFNLTDKYIKIDSESKVKSKSIESLLMKNDLVPNPKLKDIFKESDLDDISISEERNCASKLEDILAKSPNRNS